MAVLLEDRNAVVYGAGGSVGRAVALAFAREGARVFLAGRTRAALDAVAEEVSAGGGSVQTAEVDTLDQASVDAHADAVVREVGGIDVSFNAVSHGDVHGPPLLEMPYEDFVRPITVATGALFLTARAGARHMVKRGSGVIMAITASTSHQSLPEVGGTAVAFDAIESQCRQWATELGPQGVRVLWLKTTGLPEALADVDLFPAYGTGAPMTRSELIEWNRGKTMLKRLTTLDELGNAAAFAASDRAGAMTACAVNLTCGAVPG
jgi:3-oxoacyl-[acyl-carrier protein] reductase